jgi:putative Mg2+ transporter-C (MgtC) family protein
MISFESRTRSAGIKNLRGFYGSMVTAPFLLDVAFAAFLGLLVGLERELSEKPAGMRTYAMIAGAICALVILSFEVMAFFDLRFDSIAADPIRIVNAIIIGISFIGGGIIFKDQEGKTVEFLTTSATILAVTAIGIAVGISMYWFAVGLTAIILFVNWILKYPESLVRKHLKRK